MPDPVDDIVSERGEKYGPPELNHATTAAFWNTYIERLGRPLDERDVCWMNVLQKCSRDLYVIDPDNTLDSQGYLRNAERIADVTRKKEET